MTPILQTILPLVNSYGTVKALEWIEGREELAIPDDDLTSFLARNDVEFDQLDGSDQDVIREEYLTAVATEVAKRLSLPVSVAPAASLTCVDGEGHPQEYNPPTAEVYERFKIWWEFYSPDPGYGYSADSKEDHMRQAFWAGYCEAHNRTQTPPAASGVIPQASVAEVVKTAVEALSLSLRQWRMYAEDREGEDLEKATHTEAIWYRDSMSTLSALRLLAVEHEGTPKELRPPASGLDSSGSTGGHADNGDSKAVASQEASTTSQKGGQGA